MSTLKRSVTLPYLICYGLGTILGAGVYVLVGKVAGEAGELAPIAFLVASIVAAFSAYSYSKLSALFPKSAGEAVYIQEAFGKLWLSCLVGWLIILTGTVSAATISKGFVGYLNLFINLPGSIATPLLIILLGFIAFWGIKESLAIAAVITIVEVVGLIFVIYIASPSIQTTTFVIPTFTWDQTMGVTLGAFLAFYAYIGFEDMVNIAEEVKSPQKNLPIAIGAALIISTLLYMAIAYSAVASLSLKELSESTAPLATIVEKKGFSPKLIGLISLFAVVNGALVQIIMASRVAYGMASQGMMHPVLAKIHPARRTPVISTIAVTFIVLLFATVFPLVFLAKLTSFIILIVFTIVNLAYFKLSGYKSICALIGVFLCLSLVLLQGVASPNHRLGNTQIEKKNHIVQNPVFP